MRAHSWLNVSTQRLGEAEMEREVLIETLQVVINHGKEPFHWGLTMVSVAPASDKTLHGKVFCR